MISSFPFFSNKNTLVQNFLLILQSNSTLWDFCKHKNPILLSSFREHSSIYKLMYSILTISIAKKSPAAASAPLGFNLLFLVLAKQQTTKMTKSPYSHVSEGFLISERYTGNKERHCSRPSEWIAKRLHSW